MSKAQQKLAKIETNLHHLKFANGEVNEQENEKVRPDEPRGFEKLNDEPMRAAKLREEQITYGTVSSVVDHDKIGCGVKRVSAESRIPQASKEAVLVVSRFNSTKAME